MVIKDFTGKEDGDKLFIKSSLIQLEEKSSPQLNILLDGKIKTVTLEDIAVKEIEGWLRAAIDPVLYPPDEGVENPIIIN